MSTLTITPDKASYGPQDVITVTLSTDAPMTQTITVTGNVETAGGVELPAETETTIHGIWGPVSAPGYTAAQTDDPAVWTLAPIPVS
jgi:hypothetical protein